MAGKFHDSALHTQAKAEVRHVVFTGILDGADFAFDATVAEAAGNDDAVDTFEDFFHGQVRIFQGFRIDPVDVDFGLIGDAGMVQGFGYAEVSIVKGDILADQGYFQGLFRIVMAWTIFFQSSISHGRSGRSSLSRTMRSMPSSDKRSGTS